jgi:hypothetical protein
MSRFRSVSFDWSALKVVQISSISSADGWDA